MLLMVEFDRSGERDWYVVHVGKLASFVVRSYTEDGAKQKVDYYLEQNKFIGIDSLGKLPHSIWSKPLDSFAYDFYDNNGDEITPVRLIEDRRSLKATTTQGLANLAIPLEGQSQLFSMDTFGRITDSQNP